MIEISIQASPIDISGGFASPADTDLLYISAACYWVLAQANALNVAGAKLRQVEQTDINSAGTSLTAIMDDVLAKIYTEE
jgi:hypothetical protein